MVDDEKMDSEGEEERGKEKDQETKNRETGVVAKNTWEISFTTNMVGCNASLC